MIFAQAEPLRSSLHKLEEMLKDYSALMIEPTQQAFQKVSRFGVTFAEVSSPKWNLQGVDTF